MPRCISYKESRALRYARRPEAALSPYGHSAVNKCSHTHTHTHTHTRSQGLCKNCRWIHKLGVHHAEYFQTQTPTHTHTEVWCARRCRETPLCEKTTRQANRASQGKRLFRGQNPGQRCSHPRERRGRREEQSEETRARRDMDARKRKKQKKKK